MKYIVCIKVVDATFLKAAVAQVLRPVLDHLAVDRDGVLDGAAPAEGGADVVPVLVQVVISGVGRPRQAVHVELKRSLALTQRR